MPCWYESSTLFCTNNSIPPTKLDSFVSRKRYPIQVTRGGMNLIDAAIVEALPENPDD
jgi:hypothetical protein